ncbi:hypothetical protein PHMEG_0008593 [Phytophthora megakarya]|uniref:Uncharacterized protein n=1 Tax=Phytophthora megakarya TaxID=4795 RepID=A0A225WIA7_9STRA|nr:hypothetical protein PHMEG_0008593 [Phytophthora megakarya]
MAAAASATSSTRRYCDDSRCEWMQYEKDIIGSKLRMLTRSSKPRATRYVKKAPLQLYYYKKHGRLFKAAARINATLCIEKELLRHCQVYDTSVICDISLLTWKRQLIQLSYTHE